MNGKLDRLWEEAKRALHEQLLGEVLPPVSHWEDRLVLRVLESDCWRGAWFYAATDAAKIIR